MENELKILRATLDSSLDGILVVDHESQKVTDLNQRFLDLWGIPKELSDKKDDAALLDFVLSKLSNSDGFIQLVKELYANPQRNSIDLLEFKDGRTFERHSVPLIIDEKISGRIWFFRDISDNIEKDKAIRSQEIKLIEASKLSSLGLLAGGVAHEINNPLAIIHASLKTLTMILEKKGDVSLVQRQIDIIESTVKRIANILSGLKNISFNPGKEEIVFTSLSEILPDVLNLASEKFKLSGVEIKSPVSTQVFDKKLHVNRVQLSEVLINLLNNSYDAVVELPEKWVEIAISLKGNNILISVIDSGCGIDENDRNKIFDPFYTTKAIGKGTGIGLSISKSMIQRNGGDLSYDSESPHTKFDILLPLR